MNNRIVWLDIVKGIAIVFVVIGHNLDNSTIFFKYIYSFHMPLFFFVSGYLFNLNPNETTINFVNKKAKSILGPYFAFGLFTMLIYSIYISNDISVIRTFMFCNRQQMGNIPFNTPLWFLPCLFLTAVMYFFIRKYIRNTVIIIIILLALAIPGHLTINNPILPWTTDSALYYTLFYGIGNVMKTSSLSAKIGNKIMMKYVIMAIALIINLTQFINIGISFQTTFISDVILALSGMVYCMVAKIVSNQNFLYKLFSFLGNNSLTIMALHTPLREYVLGIFIWGVTGTFYNGYGIRLINILGSLILCVPCICFINKYIPFVAGSKRRKV